CSARRTARRSPIRSQPAALHRFGGLDRERRMVAIGECRTWRNAHGKRGRPPRKKIGKAPKAFAEERECQAAQAAPYPDCGKGATPHLRILRPCRHRRQGAEALRRSSLSSRKTSEISRTAAGSRHPE